MNISIIDHDKVSREQWQQFVDEHEYGTIFHTSYIYDVYAATPNIEPFALFAVDDNNEIQAMLAGCIQTVKGGALAFLSKRSVLFQSPIFKNETSLLELISGYLEFIQKKVIYTEIRNHYLTEDNKQSYMKMGFEFEEHLDILIDLSLSEEELWEKVHSSRKKQIKKSLKGGVVFKEIAFSDTDTCYAILQDVYNRARLPLFPKVFFEKAYALTSPKMGIVGFGAYLDEKVIGCRYVLCYKNFIYDLFAGSLPAYYSNFPNDLLPWEVFIWGKNHGYKQFDFGGAGKPNVPYGVREYKLKFGGELVNYGRLIRIHKKNMMIISKSGFAIYRWLYGLCKKK